MIKFIKGLAFFITALVVVPAQAQDYATLIITTDLPVTITINGGKEYAAPAGGAVTRLPLERGQNLVRIKPVDGGADGYDEIIQVDQPGNKVLLIDLAEKRKVGAQSAAARQAALAKTNEEQRNAEALRQEEARKKQAAEQAAIQKVNEEKRKAEALRQEEERKKRVARRKENVGGLIDLGGFPFRLDYTYRQRFLVDDSYLSLLIGGSRYFQSGGIFPTKKGSTTEWDEKHSGSSFNIGVSSLFGPDLTDEGGAGVELGLLVGFQNFKIKNNVSSVEFDGVATYGDYSYKATTLAPILGIHAYMSDKFGISFTAEPRFYIKKPEGLDKLESYHNIGWLPAVLNTKFIVRIW